ncbi:hypothetical protein PpBr36_06966 [Pyricularia pennisetigena]|uniref:hypothetical protein n=1 Tax=Pyricularia pennisetigena TaxID=1578925 RepID=UPI00114DA28F|nr:hypothetical protein PpBr36_06966 [Pyricularia pennisetigena]TLS25055.1 hypothetical protein PpBr36_06966 [Pyricularia pennisetigena]
MFPLSPLGLLPLTFLLAGTVVGLPPSSSAPSATRPRAALALAAAPPPAVPPPVRQYDQDLGNDTQNGLVEGRCAAVTVLFARGTLESGNVGTFAGPPFFQALAARLGPERLNVQGVEYPAVSKGFFSGGDASGSSKMAQLATEAGQQCPGTKVVLSGYSQGGQLVHNAARILGPQGISVVSAAVTFGDPYNPAPVPGLPSDDSMIFCHTGDDICKGGEQLFDPHFTYNRDAGAAADFIVRITKMNGPPGGGNMAPLPFPVPPNPNNANSGVGAVRITNANPDRNHD